MIPLIERIKTSLILPKVILFSTVFLFAYAAMIGYTILAYPPEQIIQESVGISDSINAIVTRDG